MLPSSNWEVGRTNFPVGRVWSIIVVVRAMVPFAAFAIAVWALFHSYSIGEHVQEDRLLDMQMRIGTLIAATIALFVSVSTFSINLFWQFQMKKIDLMRSFQERYDRLVFDPSVKIGSKPADVRHFYLRYWNFQLEQYQYWKKFYIEDAIYAYWLALRWEAYHGSIQPFKQQLSLRFDDGWKEAKTFLKLELHQEGNFIGLMQTIFDCKDAKEIPSILCEHRKEHTPFGLYTRQIWQLFVPPILRRIHS